MVQLKVNNSQVSHFERLYGNKLNCSQEQNWVRIKNQTFFIDENAVKVHSSIHCNYTNIRRITDRETDYKEVIVNYSSGSPVLGDHFKVDCIASDGSNYSNFHGTIKPSPDAVKRSENVVVDKKSVNLNVYILA